MGRGKTQKKDDKEYNKQLAKFKERFNEEFEKLHISQKAFATDTKISESSITMYRNGETLPSMKNLEKMAKVFKVSGHYLLGENKSPNYKYEDIIKETGLSPKAFQILKSIKDTNLMKTINLLIEQEEILLLNGFSPIINKKQMTQKEYKKALEKAEQSYEQEIEKLENSCNPVISLIQSYLDIKATNEDIYIMPNGNTKKLNDFQYKIDRYLAKGTINTKETIEKVLLDKIENQLKTLKMKGENKN